jgi:hypothetical protein
MKPALWRVATLGYAALLLALALSAAYASLFANAGPGFTANARTADLRLLTVTKISNRAAIAGPLEVGDTVRLADDSFANRAAFTRERPGDRFTFVRTARDGRTSTFVDTMLPLGPAPPTIWSFLGMGAVFVLVAMVIAARQPDDELARLLVGLFLALATAILTGVQPLMPVWLLVAVLALHVGSQPLSAYAALALAVAFPRRSPGGIRRLLERINPWLLIACAAVLLASYASVFAFQRRPPEPFLIPGIVLTVLYYAAITLAFVLASRGLERADHKRLRWVAWTLAAGFSGELVLLALIVAHVTIPEAGDLLNLTLLAIPFGLGYAIVRHRVVDIGFVVNRAIVFGSVSAIVVVAFMVLEWALSSAFVKVSHITSTSLELGLALALGFSLRTIHARVDRFVDDLFFRERHAADRALRAFAREVGYITEPRVAIARAHAELSARTGAASAAIYLLEGRRALRVDTAESAAPEAVDVDDPALVRMRATRTPVSLRELGSAFAGERAFPMLVRDAPIGAVVLGPKASGEAFAPDEVATIEAVANALGNALDALQTAALKAEIARVLISGESVDALRRTVDSAAWVRGVVPQPAGSLLGLGE